MRDRHMEKVQVLEAVYIGLNIHKIVWNFDSS